MRIDGPRQRWAASFMGKGLSLFERDANQLGPRRGGPDLSDLSGNSVQGLQIAAAAEHADLRRQMAHVSERNDELTAEHASRRRGMGIGAAWRLRVARKEQRSARRQALGIVRGCLDADAISGIPCRVSDWAPGLHQDMRNRPMKVEVSIEGPSGDRAGVRIQPVRPAVREADEERDGVRSMRPVQFAMHGPL